MKKFDHDIEKMVQEAHEQTYIEFANIRKQFGNNWEGSLRLNDQEKFGEKLETYDIYLESNRKTEAIPDLGDLSEELTLIHDKLDYIEMSPKKKSEQEEAYVINRRKYVTVNLEKKLRNGNEVINKSESFLKQVFDYWRKKALLLHKFNQLNKAQQLQAKRLSTFYILGEPGVGKSALLNYIFSVKSKQLLDDDILWIRVDLNEPDDSGLNLSERLAFKFLRIFCNFYLFEKKYPFSYDFVQDLKEYLLQQATRDKFFPEKDINYYVNEYVRLVNEIVPLVKLNDKFSIKRNLSKYGLDENYFSLLTHALMTFIQEIYSFSFIIIYDGLDSVTLDKIQYKTYCNWLNEISEETDNKRKNTYKALYIVTMRDYSFIQFYLKVFKENKRKGEEYSLLRVNQIEFSKILSSRFDILLGQLSDIRYSIKKNELWNIKNNLIDIVNICLYGYSPENFSKKYIENQSIKREQYDLITKLCSGNLRSVMRLFRNLLITLGSIWGDKCVEYLKMPPGYKGCLQFLEGKEWAIYRVLIFGDAGENAYRCKVTYDFGGDAHIKSRNSALIPNIFNFKEKGLAIDESVFPRNFLKIRVIQLLIEWGDQGYIFDVINKLSELYNCSKKTIRDDLREMIYDGLIYPKVEQTDWIKAEENKSNYPIKLTPLANHILNNILKESIYYEIICDDTPIDKRYEKHMVPANKYDSKISLGSYIIQKTHSILFFILYLQKIELNEIEKLKDTKLFYWKKPVFDKEKVDSLEKSIVNYVFKYVLLSKSNKELDEFFLEWKNKFV